MKIQLKLLSILTCMLLALAMMPLTAFAADDNNDEYDDGDVAIIQNIIRQSETLMNNYDLDDPAKYDFVIWANKKVTSIDLHTYRNAAGENLVVNDFIGKLDVSGLDALVTLIFPDNPHLTSLELPSSISYVNCANTGITALDVSRCPDLEILYCAGTGIAELDVSKNIALKELLCSETDIEALDVSKNPVLERLGCNNTAIKALDISNNIALRELDCSGTDIDSLDVSGNTALTSLQVLDTVSRLRVAGGHTVNIAQTANGTVFVENVDALNGTITLSSYSKFGHKVIDWNGVPANATKTDWSVTFEVTDNTTVSATFGCDGVADLLKLEVEGATLSPSFKRDVFNYSAVVAHTTDSIEIIAQAFFDSAEISGVGKKELKVGENTFTVTVTAASDLYMPEAELETVSRDYTITITRRAAEPTNNEVDDGEIKGDDEAEDEKHTGSLKSPQTGDDSNLWLWFLLALVSCGCLIGTVVYGKNKKV